MKPARPIATPIGTLLTIAVAAAAALLLIGLAALALAPRVALDAGLVLPALGGAVAALAYAGWQLGRLPAFTSVAGALPPETTAAPPASAPAAAAPVLASAEEALLLARLPGTALLLQRVTEGPLSDWLLLGVQGLDEAPAAEAPTRAPDELLSHWLARHPQVRPAEVVTLLQAAAAEPSPSGWRVLPLAPGRSVLWRAALPAEAAPTVPAPAPEPAAPPAPVVENDRESIAYTVSHDLRAPIRVVEGFARIVKEDYGHLLDRIGNDHLERILGAAQRMNGMIDALLALSRLSTQPLQREAVDLSAMATQVLEELHAQAPGRTVDARIQPGLGAQGDAGLLRTVLDNLLGNAWKYSGRRERAQIDFGALRLSELRPATAPEQDRLVFFVRDNGAGFDMRFADRLFGTFQRLHSASEFAGSGVGLASVRRIVRRHGGEVWAESAVDQGSCFYFTLG